jgi:hypothetical protein
MKKIILLIFILSTIQSFSQVEIYEITVDVKLNMNDELVLVQSVKTNKKFWIKNVTLEESKEYDILIEVNGNQNGSRIFASLLYSRYSSRQTVLDFRKVKHTIKQKIITNF